MKDAAATLDPLDAFTPAVKGWFASAFPGPTSIQAQAWESIRAGNSTLVIAPTGSGKTFAAFLSAIDELAAEKAKAAASGDGAKAAVRILYVSPLKALGADIERNLQAPLAAIAKRQQYLGDDSISQISVGMRTGDTSQAERARLVRTPPDILITTPESLYLMLTSKARETLTQVHTVIVDELHSLAGTKRGAHFSLSLERLDALQGKPVQRIGLSATIKPVATAAAFLGGRHPVEVVQDAAPPAFGLQVIVPVPDMTNITPFAGGAGYAGMQGRKLVARQEAWKTDAALKRHLRHEAADGLTAAAEDRPEGTAAPDTRAGAASIWPYLEASVLDQVLAHGSTIVFVNSRGICERLTAQLNAAYDRRCGRVPVPSQGMAAAAAYRSEIGSSTELAAESEDPIAMAHHGSVSKERRQQIERDLKAGRLKCVVATSSLELGIDMGDVDLVIQVAAPLSVSSGLQRIGRANHQVDGRSQGVIYPRTRHEVLDTAFAVEGMLAGDIEETQLIEDALDVLAQQTAAEVAVHPEGLKPDAWLDVVRRSACYQHLPRAAFDAVVGMLAGSFATGGGSDLPPRLDFDRAAGLLRPLPRTQKLAIGSAGTIPDRGLYPVMLNAGTQQKGRARVGELDEEMVHESRVGDVIILGTSTWRITEITNDRVLVAPAPGRTARLPFWHGEGTGRALAAGLRRGRLQGRLDEETDANGVVSDELRAQLEAEGFNQNAIANLGALVACQRASTHAIPTEKLILLETCPDDTGAWYLVVHSPFGKRVNEPWALAISQRIRTALGFDPECAAGDEGIVMRVSSEEEHAVTPELLCFTPDEVTDIVCASVPETSLFAARFRECAVRALLMRSSAPGKRTPLWQQRLRGGQLLEAARQQPDFPIYLEAMRECLDDVYDLQGVCWLMEQLESGAVQMKAVETGRPSPFASPLLFGYVADHLYEGDMPHAERSRALLSVDSGLLAELLGMPDQLALLEPEAVARVHVEAQRLVPSRKLVGAEGAAELLRQMGPLSVEQVAERLEGAADAAALLSELEERHRACPIALPGRTLWGVPEDALRMEAIAGAVIPGWTQAWHPAAGAFQGMEAAGALAAKRLQCCALTDSAGLAAQLGWGSAVAEAALGHVKATGGAASVEVSVQAQSVLQEANGLVREAAPEAPALPAEGEAWAASDMLRRLRLRSRDALEAQASPVEASALVRSVLKLQRVGGCPGASPGDDLAECIALFEGIRFTAAVWEHVVFPARVPGYQPTLLDELLDAEEVVWVAAGEEAKDPVAAIYPSGSLFAPQTASALMEEVPQVSPVPLAEPQAAAHPLEAEVRALLVQEGSASLVTLMRWLQERSAEEAVSPQAVMTALDGLVRKGAVTSTSFSCLRHRPARTRTAPVRSQRRVSSRRSARGRATAAARSAARASVAAARRESEALAGQWRALMSADASVTEQAIAQVESLLDLYGVICSKTIEAAGFKGGMQAIYAVLRGMEDAGEVVRGEFVAGLGASQFARRHGVEALRAEGADDGQLVVLNGLDPAQLYGSVLPWPGSGADLIPANRAGCFVVLRGGAPVLFAGKRLQHLVTFTADGGVQEAAVRALVQHLEGLTALKLVDAKEKLIVQRVDGQDVFNTRMQEVLSGLGFTRDTHGMRWYVQPF